MEGLISLLKLHYCLRLTEAAHIPPSSLSSPAQPVQQALSTETFSSTKRIMDALSSSTNLVAVLGLTLSSVRFIIKLLSAVQGCLKSVEALGDDIDYLRVVLEGLGHVSISCAADHEISDMVNDCARDIVGFEHQLKCLGLSRPHRNVPLWNKVKTVMRQNDIAKMQQTVRGHITRLSLRLQVVQLARINRLGMVSEAAVLPAAGFLALRDRMARLLQSVTRYEKTLDPETMGGVIGDMKMLLGDAQRAEAELKSHQLAGDVAQSTGDTDIRKELELVTNLVASSQSVRTGNRGQSCAFRNRIPAASVTHRAKLKTIRFGSVTLTVFIINRRWRYIKGPAGTRNLHNLHKTATGLCANLIFGLENEASLLRMSVRQEPGPDIFDSFISMSPQISAINVLPRGSDVFRVAASGNVKLLKSLLIRGRASLRDHDDHGWSLLHHAVAHPKMCRFLIEHELDVDEVTHYNDHLRAQNPKTPLHLAHFGQHQATAKVLLEGGADPTMEALPLRSVLHLTAHTRSTTTEATFRQILASSAHFGIADCRDYEGWTPLLCACFLNHAQPDAQFLQASFHINKFDLMLSQNCSVQDRANDGSNCLHIFFTSRPQLAITYNWKEVLVYLVNKGADIHAVNYAGWSVTSLAYGEAFDTECAHELGSYFGDLWDAVLYECGYNVLDFRQRVPRVAEYRGKYGRREFEALWKGMENRCPYWDDVMWPNRELNGERDRKNDDREKLCRCPWIHSDI